MNNGICACFTLMHSLQHSVYAIFIHVHVHGALSPGVAILGHVLFIGRRHGDVTVKQETVFLSKLQSYLSECRSSVLHDYSLLRLNV